MTRKGATLSDGDTASLDQIDAAKRALRRTAMAARADCDPAAGGAALARHLLAAWTDPPSACVAGFWPLPGEIDLRPLLQALHARGHTMVLPDTPKRGLPLCFRAWRPGGALLPGRFGTLHPDGPLRDPDILLVPLLAFDRRGRRLGYGAGYYDRTLAALPGRVAIGCAFAAQEVAAVPAGPADVALSMVATERGLIACGAG
ncbi:MAG TPA: 5-formyltetrahydrofolate cyclo-ligase [Acetobacteraceae bacterium]|nr:5-formyltetrahydrofolate cyclo-ligase [Acetobacteraceae bacterium]